MSETEVVVRNKPARKHTRKAKAKSSKSKRKPGAGRHGAHSGKKIFKLVKDNPRRKGTIGHRSFSLIKNGMSYEQYIKAGGRSQDLNWDLARKAVKVSK